MLWRDGSLWRLQNSFSDNSQDPQHSLICHLHPNFELLNFETDHLILSRNGRSWSRFKGFRLSLSFVFLWRDNRMLTIPSSITVLRMSGSGGIFNLGSLWYCTGKLITTASRFLLSRNIFRSSVRMLRELFRHQPGFSLLKELLTLFESTGTFLQ